MKNIYDNIMVKGYNSFNKELFNIIVTLSENKIRHFMYDKKDVVDNITINL